MVQAHPAGDHEQWLRYFAAPDLAMVTVTVTEAGYLRGANGGLDASRPAVRADVEALRADPAAAVRTAPGQAGGGAGCQAPRRSGSGRADTAGQCSGQRRDGEASADRHG